MHHRQLSAGSAVELGRAFDTLLSAAPTKGIKTQLQVIPVFCYERAVCMNLMVLNVALTPDAVG